MYLYLYIYRSIQVLACDCISSFHLTSLLQRRAVEDRFYRQASRENAVQSQKTKKGVSTDSKGFTRLGGWEGRGEWEGTIWSSPWAVRQRVSPESCRPSTTFKGKRKKNQQKETRKCKTRQNNYVFQIGLRRTICQLIYIYVFIYI